MLPFLRKDLLTLNWKRSLTMQILMLGFFLILSIGQLGELEQRLGLQIEGFIPLLRTLNESLDHRIMLTNVLTAVGLHAAALVLCLYVGIPHVLQFFTKEKSEKNLSFMLTIVSSPRKIINAVWLFAFLRVLGMTIINGVLIGAFFTVLGFHFLWQLSLLSSLLTVFLAIAAFLYLANAIVWATNGSELVLKIFRVLILIGIVAAFPAVNFLQMDFSYLDFRYTAASGLLAIIVIIFSRLLTKLFRVERVL